ncbi:TraB/GumN family protein [Chitinophaga alhagiae]|uniref:TraB/GumN family protein n=1 Tax=Chitinophaga alhagiae TaxID=2203219 RepID=UPI000E5BB2F5|nr:TraB/GumN family protein [Chitinophaga alhagiae]
MKRILFSLLLFPVLAVAQRSLPDRPQTILWKVSHRSLPGSSYVLGTNHAYPGTFIDTMQYVSKLVHEAECMVVEGKEGLSKAGLAALGVRKKSFKELFPPADYQVVDAYFSARQEGLFSMMDSAGLPVFMLMEAVMAMEQAEGGGTYQGPDGSVDTYVVKAGEGMGVPVVRLDSGFAMRDSARAHDGSEEEWAGIITGLVKDLTTAKTYSKMLADGEYGRMDIDYMFKKPAPAAPGSDDYHLLIERNRYWVPRLLKALKEKRCFVAVGLAHLQYESSLLLSLRQNGFRIEPVRLK